MGQGTAVAIGSCRSNVFSYRLLIVTCNCNFKPFPPLTYACPCNPTQASRSSHQLARFTHCRPLDPQRPTDFLRLRLDPVKGRRPSGRWFEQRDLARGRRSGYRDGGQRGWYSPSSMRRFSLEIKSHR